MLRLPSSSLFLYCARSIDAAMNHTEAERKVREATNGDEPWGPHGTLMSEIAGFTFG